METLIKHQTYRANDDKRNLRPFKSIQNSSLYYNDTDIQTLSERKEKKEKIVFLIDDDFVYLTALEHFLLEEIPSLKIFTFKTGEPSLLQMMEQAPDIVILDYFLDSEVPSAKNGIEILKIIKRLNPVTKVVMLSCQDNSKIEKESLKKGAFDYIIKDDSAFTIIKYLIINISGNNDSWID